MELSLCCRDFFMIMSPDELKGEGDRDLLSRGVVVPWTMSYLCLRCAVVGGIMGLEGGRYRGGGWSGVVAREENLLLDMRE